MIAEVYPLKRMPRKFGVFDYQIPDHLSLERGNAVQIPFRGSMLLGIVARVKDKPLRGIQLKTLSEFPSGISLSDKELKFFEDLAADLAQSVSSLLNSALPHPPKRASGDRPEFIQPIRLTIPSSEAPMVTHVVHEMQARGEAFIKLPDLRRTAAVLSGYIQEQNGGRILILAPTVRDAQLLAKSLASHRPLLISGNETNNARYEVWKSWQKMKSGVLIGSRVAALMPHEGLTSVIVTRSSHPNHKQDRNPRFDTRRVARRMQDFFQARLFFLDVAPRVDEYASFSQTNILEPEGIVPVTIVNMNLEGPTAPHPMLGYTTANAIEETLAEGKQVICVYNKKGVSRQLKCHDCSHTFPCPTCSSVLAVYERAVRCHRCNWAGPLPISCPKCRGQHLQTKGFGNRGVRQAFAKLFPGTLVTLIEKGAEGDRTAPIIVVTQYYYEQLFTPFRPDNIGLVVELNADAPLFEPTIRAFEEAVLSTEAWRGVAHASRATFIIQTQAPDLFAEYFEQPDTVYARELKTRISYDQPPARDWMHIEHKSEEPRASEIAMNLLATQLKTALPNALIVGPKRIDGSPYQMDIGVPPEERKALLSVISQLSDAFVVDTNMLF